MILGVKEKPALRCVASVLEAVGGPHFLGVKAPLESSRSYFFLSPPLRHISPHIYMVHLCSVTCCLSHPNLAPHPASPHPSHASDPQIDSSSTPQQTLRIWSGLGGKLPAKDATLHGFSAILKLLQVFTKTHR